MKPNFKAVKFPQDELAHDNIIEWWYFNGRLRDQRGRSYAFMDCLFKADNQRVNIPFLKNIPLKNIYFAHSILSDIGKQKAYAKTHYASLVSQDSFSLPRLFVNYINVGVGRGYVNCEISSPAENEYRLKTEDLNLELKSVKKPLLVGGKGYLERKSWSTYYYSLTNLEAKGMIKINKRWVEVAGKVWMDHQWADTPYAGDRWTWFSIQLSNQTEIMCFEYDDGKNKDYFASVIDAENRQTHTKEFELKNLEKIWVSPTTKIGYPLTWQIKIPSKKIDIQVEPLVKNQEVRFGTINYWEGPLAVKGECGGHKVTGDGFLELVGYGPEMDNMDIVKNEIAKLNKKLLTTIKKRAKELLGEWLG